MQDADIPQFIIQSQIIKLIFHNSIHAIDYAIIISPKYIVWTMSMFIVSFISNNPEIIKEKNGKIQVTYKAVFNLAGGRKTCELIKEENKTKSKKALISVTVKLVQL